MTVGQLSGYLKQHWLTIREQLLNGCHSPKLLQGHKFRPVTMLQARLHAVHFKRVLDFGEGHGFQRAQAGVDAKHSQEALKAKSQSG